MKLYNTTFIFATTREQDFMTWLRNSWLPAATMAGMSQPVCAHVPQPDDSTSSQAVAVQGRFDSDTEFSAWHQNGAPILLSQLYEVYGEEIIGFTTVMEIFQP